MEPPCKYLHPPQHLKELLLQNGRQNLIYKSLALQAAAAASLQTLGCCPPVPQLPLVSHRHQLLIFTSCQSVIVLVARELYKTSFRQHDVRPRCFSLFVWNAKSEKCYLQVSSHLLGLTFTYTVTASNPKWCRDEKCDFVIRARLINKKVIKISIIGLERMLVLPKFCIRTSFTKNAAKLKMEKKRKTKKNCTWNSVCRVFD